MQDRPFQCPLMGGRHYQAIPTYKCTNTKQETRRQNRRERRTRYIEGVCRIFASLVSFATVYYPILAERKKASGTSFGSGYVDTSLIVVTLSFFLYMTEKKGILDLPHYIQPTGLDYTYISCVLFPLSLRPIYICLSLPLLFIPPPFLLLSLIKEMAGCSG